MEKEGSPEGKVMLDDREKFGLSQSGTRGRDIHSQGRNLLGGLLVSKELLAIIGNAVLFTI
jgi:hypothetical protein